MINTQEGLIFLNEKENYLTIKENGNHELTIKKSRFITTLIRTSTIEEAEKAIATVSSKYRDATHNTFAYTIGLNDEHVKASDNGEPSGTAGVPELKALQLMNAFSNKVLNSKSIIINSMRSSIILNNKKFLLPILTMASA